MTGAADMPPPSKINKGPKTAAPRRFAERRRGEQSFKALETDN